mgnify:CR=1 FL=1
MTGAKFGAVVMTALTLMYVVLLGEKGILLLGDENPVAKLLGGLVILFPVVAIWAIIRELIFGLRIEKAGKELEDSGRWPRFDFELRPSGRPTPDSAAREFDRIKSQVEADEANWISWFALGLAYDAAGDRRRARAAMRKALSLREQGPAK